MDEPKPPRPFTLVEKAASVATVVMATVVMAAVAGVDFPRWLVPLVVMIGTTLLRIAALRLPPMDEVALEAHKVAWYWGGSFGGWMASLAAVLLISYGDRIDFGGLTVAHAIAFSILGTLGVTLACYWIAWAGWWLRRR